MSVKLCHHCPVHGKHGRDALLKEADFREWIIDEINMFHAYDKEKWKYAIETFVTPLREAADSPSTND